MKIELTEHERKMLIAAMLKFRSTLDESYKVLKKKPGMDEWYVFNVSCWHTLMQRLNA